MRRSYAISLTARRVSKADFFSTARGLGFLPALFTTASWRRRTARQIVALAVVFNLLAVAICLAGAMSQLLAAILMPLSSLACLGLAARRLPPTQVSCNERDVAPGFPTRHNVEGAVATS
ncbi:MAG: hypothetical protein GWO24_30530 [Akkermansiaceae bacterium]|nr:hypothetical protein [Akkermansiaceae bacterium]